MSAGPDGRCEIAVIGGGIAGSALAALLSRSGRDVLLFEKDGLPRHKLCGEFLSAESQQMLQRVGCLGGVLALGPARITQGRFFSPSGHEAVFDLNGVALGISRWSLDETLFRHAGRSGASAHERAKVIGIVAIAGGIRLNLEWQDGRRTVVEARLVVAAYGRRSPLDAQLGRPILEDSPSALGLKRHHRPADTETGRLLLRELTGGVEIHLFEDGYCGLSRVEGGLVNVCLLVEKSFLKRLAAPSWDEVCSAMRARSASLRGRLSALVPAEDGFHAVAGLGFSPKETSLGRVIFVGDAAGMIAPLCGDGQAMALESAIHLAELIGGHPRRMDDSDIAALSKGWDEIWKSRFVKRLKRGRLLQSTLLWAPGGEAAVRLISRIPRLGSALVRATRQSLTIGG
ncbi:MAG: NAD(P)/FAD-dependent oxidoreductase [Elusimicrobiota bacterium]